MDVAVIDPDTGVECPRARFGDDRRLLNPEEAIGEIVGRSELSAFEGYYANPEATAERGRDGWYWTGDLGYQDDDGTFYFAGRTADWLRVDGENFAAGPIERILGRFPGVASAVVYGVPDPRTGDQVMAALELDAGRRVRRRRVRPVPRRAARPRHEVGAALRADRRRHPRHRHRQGRPEAAARGALDDDATPCGGGRRRGEALPAAHRRRRRRPARRVPDAGREGMLA